MSRLALLLLRANPFTSDPYPFFLRYWYEWPVVKAGRQPSHQPAHVNLSDRNSYQAHNFRNELLTRANTSYFNKANSNCIH